MYIWHLQVMEPASPVRGVHDTAENTTSLQLAVPCPNPRSRRDSHLEDMSELNADLCLGVRHKGQEVAPGSTKLEKDQESCGRRMKIGIEKDDIETLHIWFDGQLVSTETRSISLTSA